MSWKSDELEIPINANLHKICQGTHEFGEGFDLFPRCLHAEDLAGRDHKPYLRPGEQKCYIQKSK